MIGRGRQEWAYALPFVGSYLYRYDRMKDNFQRDKDFKRHTGRDYAYGTDGYGAQAFAQAGQIMTDAFRMVGGQYSRMTRDSKKDRRD